MIYVALRAHPKARVEKVMLRYYGQLDVHVRVPAVDGRANAAVLKTLAAALDLRPSQVRLVHGERAKDKLVEIDLPSRDELRRRISRAVEGLGRA